MKTLINLIVIGCFLAATTTAYGQVGCRLTDTVKPWTQSTGGSLFGGGNCNQGCDSGCSGGAGCGANGGGVFGGGMLGGEMLGGGMLGGGMLGGALAGGGCGPVGGGMLGGGCGPIGGGMIRGAIAGAGCGPVGGMLSGGGCDTGGGVGGLSGGCGLGGSGCGLGGGGCGPGGGGGIFGRLFGGKDLYISGGFGINIWDAQTQALPAIPTPQFGLNIDDSPVYRVAFGRRIGMWRSEFEGAYRVIDGTGTQPGNSPGETLDITGENVSTAIMFNLVRHLSIGRGRVIPYAKAGIGVVHNRVNAGFVGTTPTPGGGILTRNGVFPEGSEIDLAWQAGGGLSLAMSSRMFMDVEYMFVNIGDPVSGTATNGDMLSFTDTFSHQATIAFRIDF